ncbi:HAMP domain-containing sensor histidine kinase [Haloimpatiens massiliensis]|uniref:HAMP domain-containing sensor histidine kinase n=1 Tax=Haloimpatiens massiliensis TaxID=1658110 RepID=UPI000C8269C4|nr:HAMP domain-containing sensor histidine kinase [Haloimpatiens massiliensis]
MKARKSIKHFLFQNYAIIIIISIIIYFIGMNISNFIIKSLIYRNIEIDKFEPKQCFKYPYDEINSKSIELFYGWVEILDENKKVVCVRGNKLDDKYQYTEEMLYNYCAIHDYSKPKSSDSKIYSPYIYSIYPIKGPHDETYLYIIKFPQKLFNTSVTLKIFSLPSKFTSLHIIVILVIIIVFLILFLSGLVLYSRFTAKHIKKPLECLQSGFEEIKNKNYKVRLNFYAEREFAEIRDVFNDMINRLEKSEKEKEEISRNKQRMLVDISHDLKTPITSIQGFSKLLYDGEIKSKDDNAKYLKYIYDKSVYVTNLIQDLFDLSKIDDESYPFIYMKRDFSEWIRRLISEMYPEFEKNNFIINVDISEIPIIFAFDEKCMSRAIKNILNNALKYNPSGTNLWIYCYNEGHKVILKIGDNGIGIKDDLKTIIFNPFVRGDEARSTKDGTGLGLAIAKKIIERHNGTISLSSNEKAVTVFTIELPL